MLQTFIFLASISVFLCIWRDGTAARDPAH